MRSNYPTQRKPRIVIQDEKQFAKDVARLYSSGKTQDEIAIIFGCARSFIQTIMVKHAIPVRKTRTQEQLQRLARAAKNDWERNWNHPPDCPHCNVPEHSQDEPTYDLLHQWLKRDWGNVKTYDCRICYAPAREYALDESVPLEFLRRSPRKPIYSIRTEDYIPLCKFCHRAWDRERWKLTRG